MDTRAPSQGAPAAIAPTEKLVRMTRGHRPFWEVNDDVVKEVNAWKERDEARGR